MKAMHSLSRTSQALRGLCVGHLTPATGFPALTAYLNTASSRSLLSPPTARSFQTKSKRDQSVAEATSYSSRSMSSDLFPLDYRPESSHGESQEQIKPKRRGRGPSRKKAADKGQFSFYRPPSTATNTSWSSPHDNVARQSFMKNYSHLWTLLEACLDTQNFARAEDVLINFTQHSAPKDVGVAVNNYLLRLAEVNENDATVAQKWLASISEKLPMFQQDSVTHAIILRNICLATGYDKEAILKYLTSTSPDFAVLKHVDVLGIEMISNIIKVSFEVH